MRKQLIASDIACQGVPVVASSHSIRDWQVWAPAGFVLFACCRRSLHEQKQSSRERRNTLKFIPYRVRNPILLWFHLLCHEKCLGHASNSSQPARLLHEVYVGGVMWRMCGWVNDMLSKKMINLSIFLARLQIQTYLKYLYIYVSSLCVRFWFFVYVPTPFSWNYTLDDVCCEWQWVCDS